MTMEELLYRRLTGHVGLGEKLTRYAGAPAVFYQSAPHDKALGWKGKSQYPRIDYVVDLRADPERQTSGVLTANLWCAEEGETQPEELEPLLRDALQGGFLCPDAQPPFSLAWARSEPFESRAEASPNTLVVGVTVQFDLYAFPPSITSDPDPVQAMGEWARESFPAALVVGRDEISEEYRPTAARPALYFRLKELSAGEETNTVRWMNATVVGHIFAPSAADRVKWLRALVDVLALEGEVTMADTSPMRLTGLSADSGASELSAGQLRLKARFGLLRARVAGCPLTHINIKQEG